MVLRLIRRATLQVGHLRPVGNGTAVVAARYLPRRRATREVGGRPRRAGLPATPCADLPLPPPQNRRPGSSGGSRPGGLRRRGCGTRARRLGTRVDDRLALYDRAAAFRRRGPAAATFFR